MGPPTELPLRPSPLRPPAEINTFQQAGTFDVFYVPLVYVNMNKRNVQPRLLFTVRAVSSQQWCFRSQETSNLWKIPSLVLCRILWVLTSVFKFDCFSHKKINKCRLVSVFVRFIATLAASVVS